MKSPIRLVTIAITALLIPLAGFAGSTRNAPKRTPIPPTHITISAVNDAGIVTTDGKKQKSYKITKDTVIIVKGEKSTVKELAAGMRVSVTTGSDPDVAQQISASEAPKPSKATPAPKK